MVQVGAGFNHVVVNSLPLVHRLLAVGFNLELVDGLDGNSQCHFAGIALLIREGERQTFQIEPLFSCWPPLNVA